MTGDEMRAGQAADYRALLAGLTGRQIKAAASFAERHELRSSGYCTCHAKMSPDLYAHTQHLDDELRRLADA